MKMDIIDLIKARASTNNGYYGAKPGAQVHEFYLTGEIQSPENYTDWFDIIRHAGESDVIKIYINSYGGDLFTAIQFLRVLSESAAMKVVSVEGACMSAATMIFMCADSFEVTPHSVFMFHNYSGGTIGKGGEMIDQLLHERKWSEKLLSDIYDGFMTKDEIKAMLDNRDIWMDGEEVVRRVNIKLDAVTKKAKEQEEVEVQKMLQRKPRAKKTTDVAPARKPRTKKTSPVQ